MSLVELVIVVIIIGIVASIAVPRVSRGIAAAGEAGLRADLKALRDAIDRYAAEHLGELPGATADGTGNASQTSGAFVNQLIMYSNETGAVSATKSVSFRFGPYLRRIPPIPVGGKAGNSSVVIDKTNSPPLVTVGPEAWVYNPKTGEIIANSDEPSHDGLLTFDEF